MRLTLALRWGVLSVTVLLVACGDAPQPPATAPATEQKAAQKAEQKGEMVLWRSPADVAAPPSVPLQPRVIPGNETEARAYYDNIRPNLKEFPKAKLLDSSIEDMLDYYGFPAIPSATLEALAPAVIMDFEALRKAVATPEFDAAYKDKPLQPNEIGTVRFFAPKIVNVRDPQTEGVPVGGFGWRKVLRFRARDGSKARGAALDAFYLLFNFTSGKETAFPEKIHAGQIQAMLVPTYPTNGAHLDAYFLVYEGLGTATPGKVGLFLVATFDLAGSVSKDDKYYVPRACGQCHGTEVSDQKGAKVNYLDTDHWVDRTSNDFPKVPAANVLVDGDPSYAIYRLFNAEIAAQNRKVLVPNQSPFAALAVEKWLDLHRVGGADEKKHVDVMRRGFAENAGDAVWADTNATDRELLPLLNQYCFRCHSSVRYHVFQKKVVSGLKARIVARVRSGNMPQDRVLDTATRDKILALMNQLP